MRIELTKEQAEIISRALDSYHKHHLSHFSWEYQQIETVLAQIEIKKEQEENDD